MESFVVRPAGEEDVPAMRAIYAPYVEKTAITFEYRVPSPEEFAARLKHTQEKHPWLVAQEGDLLLGYAYAGIFVGRDASSWAVETTVYVDWDARGRGVGKALYRALENILALQGIKNLNASIAWPEKEDEYLTRISPAFHRKMGYSEVGRFRRCGCKFGRWYDLLWMEKHIGEHKGQPEPPKTFDQVRKEACALGYIREE